MTIFVAGLILISRKSPERGG